MTWQADCRNFSQYNPGIHPRDQIRLCNIAKNHPGIFTFIFLKKSKKNIDYLGIMLYNVIVGLRNTTTQTKYADAADSVEHLTSVR